jgi:hypothetical protein
MPVAVLFTNGNNQPFPTAETAFTREGTLIVVLGDGSELKFDLAQLVSATVINEDGKVITVVPGGAKAITPDIPPRD